VLGYCNSTPNNVIRKLKVKIGEVIRVNLLILNFLNENLVYGDREFEERLEKLIKQRKLDKTKITEL